MRYLDEPLTYYRRHGLNTSGSNGKSVLQCATHTRSEEWLDWPTSFVRSYSNYSSKFGDRLPDRAKRELEQQQALRKQLMRVIESKNRISAAVRMAMLSRNLYSKYLGTWETRLLDIMNVLICK